MANAATLAERIDTVREQVAADTRVRVLFVRRKWATNLADRMISWTKDAKQEFNLTGPHLREHVKWKMQEEYGSVVAIILFTIIWKLIEQYILDIL